MTKGDYNSAVADVVKAGELAPKKDPQAIAATPKKNSQAIAAKPLPSLKAAVTPPKKSAPATWEGTLPAWAQALFGKSAQQE